MTDERTKIRPEVRVFIAALRAGKRSRQAFTEYCWAKAVVPIDKEGLERTGDPFRCAPHWWTMAEAEGADAHDEGADDDAIAKAFDRGMETDRERGVLYRPMKKEERPKPGELLASMPATDRETAMEIFGAGRVVKQILADNALDLLNAAALKEAP